MALSRTDGAFDITYNQVNLKLHNITSMGNILTVVPMGGEWVCELYNYFQPYIRFGSLKADTAFQVTNFEMREQSNSGKFKKILPFNATEIIVTESNPAKINFMNVNGEIRYSLSLDVATIQNYEVTRDRCHLFMLNYSNDIYKSDLSEKEPKPKKINLLGPNLGTVREIYPQSEELLLVDAYKYIHLFVQLNKEDYFYSWSRKKDENTSYYHFELSPNSKYLTWTESATSYFDTSSYSYEQPDYLWLNVYELANKTIIFREKVMKHLQPFNIKPYQWTANQEILFIGNKEPYLQNKLSYVNFNNRTVRKIIDTDANDFSLVDDKLLMIHSNISAVKIYSNNLSEELSLFFPKDIVGIINSYTANFTSPENISVTQAVIQRHEYLVTSINRAYKNAKTTKFPTYNEALLTRLENEEKIVYQAKKLLETSNYDASQIYSIIVKQFTVNEALPRFEAWLNQLSQQHQNHLTKIRSPA